MNPGCLALEHRLGAKLGAIVWAGMEPYTAKGEVLCEDGGFGPTIANVNQDKAGGKLN